MTQVSLIIVNWNGRQYLASCLDAVLAQTQPDVEVVVVDNGSTDGSPEMVRASYPTVRLLENDRNLGFAAANNQGIRATRSEYLATLNNDALPDPAWLSRLVAVLQTAPKAGMCASKMLFADRRNVINSAGVCLDRAGIAWDRLGGQRDSGGEEEPYAVFGASAGAALYRRAMLEEIGLFDQAFFMYLEDVDLAWRAQLAGWKALYAPQAVVYHLHSATAGQGSAFKRRLLGRNKLWLMAKNYPRHGLMRYLPAIVAYDAMAVAYTLLFQRDINPLKGRIEGLKGLRPMMKKRRRVQRLGASTAHVESTSLLEPLAPPWRVWERFAHLESPET